LDCLFEESMIQWEFSIRCDVRKCWRENGL